MSSPAGDGPPPSDADPTADAGRTLTADSGQDRAVGAAAGAPLGGSGGRDRGRGLERGPGRRGTDLLFRRLALGAAGLTVLLIIGIGAFLILEAIPALRDNTGSFFSTKTWFPNSSPPVFGIAAIAFGTLLSSVLALALAVPVAVGVALFISTYAPRRLAIPLGYVVDLLAAVPSVVYGLWGALFLNQYVIDFSGWLEKYFGWIPLFSTGSGRGPYGKSILLAGIVLAVMVLPITAAISREVFLQVPSDHKEAALALGATRWEMVRTAVLPYGRPGVIAASMLGLGRALGETIAVALVLAANYDINFHLLEPAGNTIAANIALQFAEAGSTGRGALIASGLALFVITLIVNYAARAVIARRREFAGASG
jgi:phosphate transport system permease protein